MLAVLAEKVLCVLIGYNGYREEGTLSYGKQLCHVRNRPVFRHSLLGLSSSSSKAIGDNRVKRDCCSFLCVLSAHWLTSNAPLRCQSQDAQNEVWLVCWRSMGASLRAYFAAPFAAFTRVERPRLWKHGDFYVQAFLLTLTGSLVYQHRQENTAGDCECVIVLRNPRGRVEA